MEVAANDNADEVPTIPESANMLLMLTISADDWALVWLEDYGVDATLIAGQPMPRQIMRIFGANR